MAKHSKASNPKASKKLEKLFTDQPKPEPNQTLWGSSVLFELVLVRPWILVCGFWLLLIMLSALALGGLKDPGKELAEPTPVPETVEHKAGAAVTTRLQTVAEAPQPDPAATSVAPAELSMPTWPLWTLVAVCAGGCLAMSRPAVAVARRNRRRATPKSRAVALKNKRLTRRKPEESAPEASRREKSLLEKNRAKKSRTGKRKKRLKPQQPSSQVMSIRSKGTIQRVAPPTQKPTAAGRLAPHPKKISKKGVSFDFQQPAITVVPANENHPLDWQEGSLAHKLDVRQKRSLNSFL